MALVYAAAAAWRSPRELRAVPRSEYKSAEDGLLDSAWVIAATLSLADFAESAAVSDARGGSGVVLAECADRRSGRQGRPREMLRREASRAVTRQLQGSAEHVSQ